MVVSSDADTDTSLEQKKSSYKEEAKGEVKERAKEEPTGQLIDQAAVRFSLALIILRLLANQPCSAPV